MEDEHAVSYVTLEDTVLAFESLFASLLMGIVDAPWTREVELVRHPIGKDKAEGACWAVVAKVLRILGYEFQPVVSESTNVAADFPIQLLYMSGIFHAFPDDLQKKPLPGIECGGNLGRHVEESRVKTCRIVL